MKKWSKWLKIVQLGEKWSKDEEFVQPFKQILINFSSLLTFFSKFDHIHQFFETCLESAL
jgi:hypothetical protein